MSAMTNGIGWFQIGTDDPAGTERFYGGLFGWTFTDDGNTSRYRIVQTPAASSIRGGIFDHEGQGPNHAIFCIEVADVAGTCAQSEAAGGKVLVPPSTTADGLVFADLLDPSGNHFGIYTPPARSNG
jgi:predicted enzyme related to lactoylglutathione lyase